MEAGVEAGELAGADYCGEFAGHIYAVYVHDRCRAMTETMAMVSLLRT